VDGNTYVDYVSGHGALILGHSHPEIVKAVQDQMVRGTHLGGNTVLELRWAERIRALMPSLRKVRFHSSGTEAVMMAARLARAFTGRDVIVKFERHFHGWYDDVSQLSAAQKTSGITADALLGALVLPRPDATALREVLRSRGDIAAVILEPTGARMGAYPLEEGQLAAIREVTRRHDVLLILDEVVTGFRVSSGGAQAVAGVEPDLTVLAKILAGGLPGGAVGGRADILDMISFHEDPAWDIKRRVAHQGTFNANPVSAAAGIRCLELLAERPVNDQATRAGENLRDGLNQLFRRNGVPAVAAGSTSLVRVLLGVEQAPDEAAIARGLDNARGRVFRQAMMNQGVDLMTGNLFIVSSVHGDDEIDETIRACAHALEAMRAEGAIG
jgi:glutamate-1-semialdehyde 2,1-aminomutase